MKNLDLIEGYFENSLNAKQRIEFNELIQTDEEFKKEFLFQKDLKRVIRQHQNEELKETLVQFESKLKRNFQFGMLPSKWLVAASLTLILSFGSWAVKNYVFPSNERINIKVQPRRFRILRSLIIVALTKDIYAL